MAPLKASRPTTTNAVNRVTTRSKHHSLHITKKGKRKADASPSKETGVKRSAFGDMTNALFKSKNDEKTNNIFKPMAKKVITESKFLPSIRTVVKPKQSENIVPTAPAKKVQTRASTRIVPVANDTDTVQKPKDVTVKDGVKAKTRLSNEFEKTEDSLYASALEDINTSTTSSTGKNTRIKSDIVSPREKMSITLVAQQMEKQLHLETSVVPDGVNDFDKENWEDVFQISNYAMDIFNYLKGREVLYTPVDYISTKQKTVTVWMRSLLVDWMVEIQESFELNHETLYLGVKLVDLYLSKVTVDKESLQLVGAAAMFTASKYDERIPPLVDDFLYICDGAYSRKQLLRTEIDLLKVCDFKLGLPLSYRFLRRYARCAKINMPTLTLARFILENSLLDYQVIFISDSKLAAAALFLALQMKKISGWTTTLEYFSGYIYEEIRSTVVLLNEGLHRKQKQQIMTVRNKYSHKVFFEVAKTPLIGTEDLRP